MTTTTVPAPSRPLSFVAGPSNQLAYAAARAVQDYPLDYNYNDATGMAQFPGYLQGYVRYYDASMVALSPRIAVGGRSSVKTKFDRLPASPSVENYPTATFIEFGLYYDDVRISPTADPAGKSSWATPGWSISPNTGKPLSSSAMRSLRVSANTVRSP